MLYRPGDKVKAKDWRGAMVDATIVSYIGSGYYRVKTDSGDCFGCSGLTMTKK